MSRGRGYQNVNSLRRKLKKINKHVENGIKPELQASLEMIVSSAKANAPRDKGDLIDSIAYATSSDGLAGVAGPSAKNAKVKRILNTGATSVFATSGGAVMSQATKKKIFQFFKGYWIEFGTKGAPDRNIPPQPARPFMQPAWDTNEKAIKTRMREALNEQLRKAAEL
jgi:HK97 gp10 family phage protein